jgi:hypothetical protein
LSEQAHCLGLTAILFGRTFRRLWFRGLGFTPPGLAEVAMQLAYLKQDCPLTLRAALDEYYAQIPDLITEANSEARTAALFRRHDVGHVVFGCDTTLNGEPLADTFCMFGSDVKLKEYAEYAKIPETKKIFKDAGIWLMVYACVRCVPAVIVALWRCWRMPKKWSFWHNDQWLDVPLRQIRAEFGIHVVKH